MADGTKIEWTEATWNPITGCSVTSPGCTNCYAMKLAGARMKHEPSRAGLTRDSKAGPVWTGEVRFNEQWLDQPLRWKRPRMIFVCAHGDLFHENVPDEWIDRVFAVMALCPQHTFQVLTKRSARMREYIAADRRDLINSEAGVLADWHTMAEAEWPLPNVWLGVSVEDQARADERIPDLLATPAAVRWLSCEPLLGPVDLERICLVPRTEGSPRAGIHINALQAHYVESGLPYIGPWSISGPLPANAPALALDWIVAGGESGPGARPMHPDWARSLRDQCAAAGVPFFFKQWGDWAPGEAFGMSSDQPLSTNKGHVRDWMHRYVVARSGHSDERGDRLRAHSFTGHATDLVYRVGKKRSGRLLDGQLHDAMPLTELTR